MTLADPFLSIIVPVLNEAGTIGPLIRTLRDVPECEIIVVDGDSADRSVEEALAAGADRVLAAPRGRAAQQNAGAAEARGEALFFLHADCAPAPGFETAIRAALYDPRCVGGCFRQRIDRDGPAYRLLDWGNALRVRTLQWAYGDQGIFVRREVFESLGGFPDLALLEDLYFSKRLKRAGRLRLLSPRLRVSARRWQRRGVLRQTLRNWALIALAHCGVPPDRLARLYQNVR